MDFRYLIARRYLASPKRVTLISVITGISIAGVSLGVAALVVVLSVMNGFYDFVRDLLVSLDPHVRIVSAEGRGFANPDSLRAVALDLAHVDHASPYVEGKALLTQYGGEINKVVIVRGVDPETLPGVSRVADQTDFGRFSLERQERLPGIVLGMSLGQRLGLLPQTSEYEGSQASLLSAPAIERMLTNPFAAPNFARFEVRGLYELEDLYDENHVFVGIDEAQRLFRMQGHVTGLELRLDDLLSADAVKADLQARLDPARFEVLTWYDLQKSLYDVMRLEKWAASLILLLIVVVAAFNIVGSLMMVVIEKRRDVGVLQAMGVSRRDVRRIFLLEGLLIGGIGAGIGLVLGLGLAFLQQRFGLVPLAQAESFMIDAYPVAVQPLDVALVVVVAVGLCVLASVYPALRASAIEPAQAVQLEG